MSDMLRLFFSDAFAIVDAIDSTNGNDVAPVCAYITRAVLYANFIDASGFFIKTKCIPPHRIDYVNKKPVQCARVAENKKNPQHMLRIEFPLVNDYIIITKSHKSQDSIYKCQIYAGFTWLFHRHRPTNIVYHDAKLMHHFHLCLLMLQVRRDI